MTKTSWLMLILSAAACGKGAETPELEALPIRDTLLSSVASVAKLSAAQRARMAERLVEQTELDELLLSGSPIAIAREIEAGDAQLAAVDRDAWIFVSIEGAH